MSKIDEFLSSLGTGHTKTAGMDKLAEEIQNANTETVDAASSLHVCSSYLSKVAEVVGSEGEGELAGILKEAADSLSNAGSNLYTGISKIACGDVDGMIVDMVQTQDGLSKIAEAISILAANFEDETFTKVAETIIAVNNDMFDELAELAGGNENVAEYISRYNAE